MTDLRWGFIGAGNVTSAKSSPGGAFTQDRSRVVAVMRSNQKRAEEYALANGIPLAFDSVESLLGDPEVNAVYVCTPPHLHAEHVVAALRAGKHVLCEKPMALSSADCLAMAHEAERTGAVLAVAYYRRLYPVIEQLREIIHSGELGQLTSAQVVRHDFFAPSCEEVAANARIQWILSDRQSGGILNEMACHRLDLLLYLLGEASSVSALIDHSAVHPTFEDRATMTIKFEGGAVAQAYHSWCNRSPRDFLAVAGTEAHAIVDDLESNLVVVQTARERRTIEVASRPAATHRAVVADFVRAVNEGEPVRCSGIDAARVARLTEQAYIAAAERRWKDIPKL